MGFLHYNYFLDICESAIWLRSFRRWIDPVRSSRYFLQHWRYTSGKHFIFFFYHFFNIYTCIYCFFVLQIISKDDSHWWQARKDAAGGSAGLVPSPELQEWRAACAAAERSNADQGIRFLLSLFLFYTRLN